MAQGQTSAELETAVSGDTGVAKVSPVMRIVMVATVLVAGWMMLQGTESAAVGEPEVKPTELFQQAAPCAVDSHLRIKNGYQWADAAWAKSERYVFDPQDGIAAVQLYQKAEACLSAGGNRSAAEQVSQRRVAMEKRVTGDYTAHRMQLRRALRDDHPALALEEVQALRRFVAHRPDAYGQELAQLERSIGLKMP